MEAHNPVVPVTVKDIKSCRKTRLPAFRLAQPDGYIGKLAYNVCHLVAHACHLMLEVLPEFAQLWEGYNYP
jgi:hypothetical protein